MAPDMNLGGVTSANELLRRVGGEQILVLLQRLGFWVGSEQPEKKKSFPLDISKLDSNQLGDEASYWQSELSRITAILGALESRKLFAENEVKRAKNAGLARLSRGYREKNQKQPAATVVAAEVASLPEVMAAEETLLAIAMVTTSLEAAKEGIEGYCRTTSREISRRGDLLRSGVERR